MIGTVNDILNFCNSAVLYDYKNFGVIMEINEVRRCIFNNFHQTIPTSRNLVSQDIIDDMISKFMIMIWTIYLMRYKIYEKI